MSCPGPEILMRAVDGDDAEVVDHLNECGPCRERTARARMMASLLREAAFEEGVERVRPARRRVPWFPLAAAVFLIGFCLVLIVGDRSAPPVPAEERRPSATQDEPADPIIQKLGSSSFREQGEAAQQLEEMGTEALSALERAAKSENEQIREWADKIRKRIAETDRRIQELIAQLARENPEDRRKAGDALVTYGRRAVPALETAAKSENPRLRGAAANLLALLRAARGGGGADTESAPIISLVWLARHQGPGGSWSAEDPRCYDRLKSQGKCGAAPGANDCDIGVTGLALLAFLGAGYSNLSKDTYDGVCFGEVVKEGTQFLIRQQGGDGRIGGKSMRDHFQATCALLEAFGLTGSKLFEEPAKKALRFTLNMQNRDGGWGDSDESGWAVYVLFSADTDGLAVPRSAWDGIRGWCERSANPKDLKATALALLARILSDRNRGPKDSEAAERLLHDLPEPHDIRAEYWLHASTALYQYDGPSGDAWSTWSRSLKNAVLKTQRSDRMQCGYGSWESAGEGNVSGTALNTLSLETYYRYANVLGAPHK